MNKDLTVSKPSQVYKLISACPCSAASSSSLAGLPTALLRGKLSARMHWLLWSSGSCEITPGLRTFAFGCNIGCSVMWPLLWRKGHDEMKTSITSLIGSAVLCAVLMGIGLLVATACWSSSTHPRDSCRFCAVSGYRSGPALPCSSTTLPPASSLPWATAKPPSTSRDSSLSNIGVDILFVAFQDGHHAGVAWATFLCQGVRLRAGRQLRWCSAISAFKNKVVLFATGTC